MKVLTHNILLIAAAIVAMFSLTACIEDGVSTSPDDQPLFSTTQLDLGEIFTDDPTPTRRFTVYNRHSKIISIDRIWLRDDPGHVFRLNVDGLSAREFSNVEIRPNDSIFVFVEATLPTNGSDDPVAVEAHLDFLTRGVTSTVTLRAVGQDVNVIHGKRFEEDAVLAAARPYHIYDSLVVAPDATLTIEAGAKLYFHDSAILKVRGTLVAEGTPEAPIEMTGDRRGNVAASIPYELLSGQWEGVYFHNTSRANRLAYASIRNTAIGVIADSLYTATDEPGLTLVNCQLRNSQYYALASYYTDVRAIGCEFTDAAEGVVYLEGGNHVLNHCTLANYYLFSVIGGPALQLMHVDDDSDTGSPLPRLSADVTNTIIYGIGSDISHGDLEGTAVTLRRCLLRSKGTDDENFLSCLWDTDPMYFTDRSAYLFDYRLREGSPARGAAEPSLTLPEAATDRYGLQRGTQPNLGAYASE